MKTPPRHARRLFAAGLFLAALSLSARTLVQESFPVGGTAYPSNPGNLISNQSYSGDGIVNLTSGWSGSSNTSVFKQGSAGALSFPAGIDRTPLGNGAFIKHSQAKALTDDYGRILGRAIAESVSSRPAAGVAYLGLLVKTTDAIANDLLAEGHWRMMGVSPALTVVSTSALMDRGVFLGTARINDQVVNALKVGTGIVPISPNTVGTTHFLVARIDFDENTVYAREITSANATDTLSDYPAQLPLDENSRRMLFSYLVIGGDYAVKDTSVCFDEVLLSTRFDNQLGALDGLDLTISNIADKSATAIVTLSAMDGDAASLQVELLNVDAQAAKTVNVPLSVGTHEVPLPNLIPASVYEARAVLRTASGSELAASEGVYSFGTSGATATENLILVQDGFPIDNGGYATVRAKLNNDSYPLCPGILGVDSKWQYGDSGTGVFYSNPTPGLEFPAAIPRIPVGAGSASFSHSNSSPAPNDYGRILGRSTSACALRTNNAGSLYMSLLVQVPDDLDTSLIADGHWRMMGMAKTCISSSTENMMPGGVFLGIAKINGQVCNALKVGGSLYAISPNVAGTTHFLFARLDFDAGTVYAREVTEAFDDAPESYSVAASMGDLETAGLLSYFIIGGDYPSKNKNTYFDEFLLSTRPIHHTGIPSVYIPLPMTVLIR